VSEALAGIETPVPGALTPPNLLGLTRPALEALLQSWGETRFRAEQVMKWLHHRGVTDFEQMTDLSRGLRARLKTEAAVAVAEPVFEQCSLDGTRKWLIPVDGRNTVEVVFIPEEDRGTLCISSQAGCTVDCSFCATGKQGFSRNLSAAEIVGQVFVAARQLRALPQPRKVTNVVFMGMGEPLLNLDAVVDAAHIIMDDLGYGLSKRRVTVSTSGVVPALDQLRERIQVSLAVSLHAAEDALRDQLVPLNRKYPLEQLMAACDRYEPHAPTKSITYEYVMLDGVNDSDEHARALARLLKGRGAKINLIPFNPFPGSDYRRSPEARIERFQQRLQQAGLVTVPRRTRGDDIAAACGQLVGEVADRAYALLMDRLGETDAAAGNFNKALELAPADPELRNNHGGFLCRQKRLDEALAQFDKAAADPLYATPEYALTNAGICLRDAGQPARAEPYLNAALQRNPRFPSAMYQMAVTRQALGDAAGALKWLELLHERHGYTPDSLRLGWQAAQALGDVNAAGRFELLFKARYPDLELKSSPGTSAVPASGGPG